MYTSHDEKALEYKCYEFDHVAEVLATIRSSFDAYYEGFIQSEAGKTVTDEDFLHRAETLGVKDPKMRNAANHKARFLRIIKESLGDFEKDRPKYLAIFDKEALEEYQDDPSYFKSKVLRNECPIIHKTLNSKKTKELEKYQYRFRIADASELLNVVTNLHDFAVDYVSGYDEESYDEIDCYEDLDCGLLDTEDYSVFGVLGGGTKTHMLYKVYPAVFPNRSRNAIWALWYLTEKKTFGCVMDSEFLMIDTHNSTTQQNYFYPYELFAYYAHQVFQLLKAKANACGVHLDPDYRYVIVDAFFDYVAKRHEPEISFLKEQLREGSDSYA